MPNEQQAEERVGFANFKCHKCGREWLMTFPVPMHATAFTSLIRGIRCPECAATGRHIGMTKVKDIIPQVDKLSQKVSIKIEGLHCIHCGATFADVPGSDKPLDWFRKHDAECEKHPLMIRVRELEARLAAGGSER